MTISKAQRKKIEEKIYTTMDKLDKSGINSDYYRKMFVNMSDTEFEKLMKSDFPYRFHWVPFKVEPTMTDVFAAADYLKIPLIEEVNLNYLYKNKDGEAVKSKPCLVIYAHLKKVQQFITHKNKVASEIKSRDMKTGLLTYDDKGAKQSDRETESLLAMGLVNTAKEMTTFRADYMEAKSDAYNTINNIGTLSMDDLDLKQSDSLSKQLMNTYIISSLGISNLISPSYETKYTLETKPYKKDK